MSFNLWASTAQSVELLEVGQPLRPMPRDGEGWYQLLSPTARAGTRYQFRINGDVIVPDPASRFQPDDVGQPSEVIDTAALRDGVLYPGRPWPEAVIYELHVGTFSEEGTYAGVEETVALSARSRHHRDRADAAQRRPGPAQLGLRRRAAERAERALRQAGRTLSGCCARRMPSTSWSISTSSITISGHS